MANSFSIPTDSAPPMHVSLDQGLHTFEKVLNVPGYIPIVSSVSGPFRMICGKLEIITAIAVGIFLIIKGIFTFNSELRSKEIHYGIAIMANYVVHGLANIGRGIVESIPFVNLSCIVYDLSDARVKYPFEEMP